MIWNPGDLPAPFTISAVSNFEVKAGTEFAVGDNKIVVLEDCTNFNWDSKTGLVTGTNESGENRAIAFSGNPIGAIPVGGIEEGKITVNKDSLMSLTENENYILSYHYWYY